MVSRYIIGSIWDLSAEMEKEEHLLRKFYSAEYDRINRLAKGFFDEEVAIGDASWDRFETMAAHMIRAMDEDKGTELIQSYLSYAERLMGELHPDWQKAKKEIEGAATDLLENNITLKWRPKKSDRRAMEHYTNVYFLMKDIRDNMDTGDSLPEGKTVWNGIFPQTGRPYTIAASALTALSTQFDLGNPSGFRDLPSTKKLKETMEESIARALDEEYKNDGTLLDMVRKSSLYMVILSRLEREPRQAYYFRAGLEGHDKDYFPDALVTAWDAIGAGTLHDGKNSLQTYAVFAERAVNQYMESKLISLYFQKFDYKKYEDFMKNQTIPDGGMLDDAMSSGAASFGQRKLNVGKPLYSRMPEKESLRSPYAITSLLKKEDPHRMLSECTASVMLAVLKVYSNAAQIHRIETLLDKDGMEMRQAEQIRRECEEKVRAAKEESEEAERKRKSVEAENLRIKASLEAAKKERTESEKDHRREIAEKNAEIAALKRELAHLKGIPEQTEQEQKPVTEETVPKEPAADRKEKDVQSEVYQKKLVFLCDEEAMLPKIRSTFPNAKIYSEYRIYKDNADKVDAVVALYNAISHVTYYDAKEKCKSFGIPLINVSSTNFDRIAEEIRSQI